MAIYNRSVGGFLWVANLMFAILVFFASYNFNPPDSYDRFRHVERYELISGDQVGFWDYYVTGDQKDFLFYILMYFGDYVGLSHQVFFALVNSISVLLMLVAFCMVSATWEAKGKSKTKLVALMWVFLVIGFSYISLFSGVRFFLALSLFSMFIAFINRGALTVSVLFLALASVVHFSFCVFGLVYFLGFFRFLMLPLFGFGCFVALSSLLGVFDIYSVVGGLGALTGNEAIGDVSKSYAEFRGEVHRNAAFYLFNFWLFVPACYYVVKKGFVSRLDDVLFFVVFMMLFYVDNYPVFGRYFLAMNFVLVSCVIVRKDDYFKKTYINLIGLSAVVRFAFEIHDNFDAYRSSFF